MYRANVEDRVRRMHQAWGGVRAKFPEKLKKSHLELFMCILEKYSRLKFLEKYAREIFYTEDESFFVAKTRGEGRRVACLGRFKTEGQLPLLSLPFPRPWSGDHESLSPFIVLRAQLTKPSWKLNENWPLL